MSIFSRLFGKRSDEPDFRIKPRNDDDSVPDNPNFATWDDALNRPVKDAYRFEIDYVDSDGEATTRQIEPISIHIKTRDPDTYVKARCSLRNDTRVFLSSRVQRCVNLATNRSITDLGQYLRGKY